MNSEGSQLAAGQQFSGEISGDGDLQVDGRFEGTIHIEGRITVGADALVLAEIIAGSAHIEGRVEGSVQVAKEVTIGQHGCLIGDVTGLLHVEEGGVFQGRITNDSAHAAAQNNPISASNSEDVERDSPVPPQNVTSELPPVQFFDSAPPVVDGPAGSRSTIRRLTEDDTIPPAPAPRADRPAAAPRPKLPAEVPITRKQRIRTDTTPQQVPPPIVRSSSKPVRGELDDPWFETEDEQHNSK